MSNYIEDSLQLLKGCIFIGHEKTIPSLRGVIFYFENDNSLMYEIDVSESTIVSINKESIDDNLLINLRNKKVNDIILDGDNSVIIKFENDYTINIQRDDYSSNCLFNEVKPERICSIKGKIK